MDILGALKKLLQPGQPQQAQVDSAPQQMPPRPSHIHYGQGTVDTSPRLTPQSIRPSGLTTLIPQNNIQQQPMYRIYHAPNGQQTLENDNAGDNDPTRSHPYYGPPSLPDQPIFKHLDTLVNAQPYWRQKPKQSNQIRSI